MFLHNSDLHNMAESKVMVHEITSTTNADDHSTHSNPSTSAITLPPYVMNNKQVIKIPPGLVLKYPNVHLWDCTQLPTNCKWSYQLNNIPLCVPTVKELNICTNCQKPVTEGQLAINTMKKYAYVEPDLTLIVKL